MFELISCSTIIQLEGEQIFFLSLSSLAKHKWCIATVTLREGTGKVKIKSPIVKTSVNDILYFTRILHRFVRFHSNEFFRILFFRFSDQLLYPFKVLDRVNLFDIDVVYDGIGFTAQAIATRLAISKALCSFISSKEVEYLRLAGLLTDDARRKERKQPGRRNARRKYKLYVPIFLSQSHSHLLHFSRKR